MLFSYDLGNIHQNNTTIFLHLLHDRIQDTTTLLYKKMSIGQITVLTLKKGIGQATVFTFNIPTIVQINNI